MSARRSNAGNLNMQGLAVCSECICISSTLFLTHAQPVSQEVALLRGCLSGEGVRADFDPSGTFLMLWMASTQRLYTVSASAKSRPTNFSISPSAAIVCAHESGPSSTTDRTPNSLAFSKMNLARRMYHICKGVKTKASSAKWKMSLCRSKERISRPSAYCSDG